MDLAGAAKNLRRALTLDNSKSETFVRELFATAGVEIGGNQPHDIQVHDKAFYTRLFIDGTLGIGETYMDGMWDADALDEAMSLLLAARLDIVARGNLKIIFHTAKAKLLNLQTPARAFEIGERHYDIGNELYERMLDSNMAYTCGYWSGGAQTLEEAQRAKLDLVCRKVGLEPGMRVLELGCGWGGFAKYAAENYGVSVLGLTVSKEQTAFGNAWTKGLPVEIRTQDYREASGQYDAVVSIGLMEHVGTKNYRKYMELLVRLLAPNGIALVHTIGGNRAVTNIEPWFEKYIFPNAVLPTIGSLGAAIDDLLVCEDIHNFGPDYDLTLMAWMDNFNAAWPELQAIDPKKYDERFYRMWTFYLMTSAACFRIRYNQLYQMVLTRPGRARPPRLT